MSDIGCEKLSARDLIYFGSQLTYLAQVPGEVVPFVASEWTEGRWMEDARLRQGLIPLDTAQARHMHGAAWTVLPGIPAPDIVRVNDTNPSLPRQEEENERQALIFPAPVVKVPKDHPCQISSLTAVASGARSALVKLPGAAGWVRLKGCGNHEEGFVVRVNKATSDHPEWIDIRGCAFPHTALRELLLSGTLQQGGRAVCANKPLAMFLYAGDACLPLGPQISTACIVERTLGDRRLGTHALAGLLLLLPLLVSESSSASLDKLSSLFPALRPGRLEGDVADTAWLVSDYSLATSHIGGGDSGVFGLHWPELPRDSTLFLDATKTKEFSESVVERVPESVPEQLTREGMVSMPDAWKAIWDTEVAISRKAFAAISSASRVLPFLFRLIGLEAGRTLRQIHRSGMSWGTYQDAMCRKEWDEWHCNAHANNFVILPEDGVERFDEPPVDAHRAAKRRNVLLAFLDLDMAFSKPPSTVLDSCGGNEFEKLLWREYVFMMDTLAMGDASTGVPLVAGPYLRRQSPFLRCVSSALRDTLVLGFQDGYLCDPADFEDGPDTAEMTHAAHCIVRLALIVTARCTA
jgi:hypothetical protein